MSLRIPSPQTRLSLLVTIFVTIFGYWYYYAYIYQQIEGIYTNQTKVSAKSYPIFDNDQYPDPPKLELSLDIPKTLSSIQAQPLWFNLSYPAQNITNTVLISNNIDIQVIVSYIVKTTETSQNQEAPQVYGCEIPFNFQDNCYNRQNIFEFRLKPHQKINQPIWLSVSPMSASNTTDWQVEYQIDIYARYPNGPVDNWFYDDVDFATDQQSEISIQKSAWFGLVYFLLTPPWANGFLPVLALAIVYFAESLPVWRKDKREWHTFFESPIFFGLVLWCVSMSVLVLALGSLVLLLKFGLAIILPKQIGWWLVVCFLSATATVGIYALIFLVPAPKTDGEHDFWREQFRLLADKLQIHEIRKDIKDYQKATTELSQQFVEQYTTQQKIIQKNQNDIQCLEQLLEGHLQARQKQMDAALQSHERCVQTLESLSKEIAQSLTQIRTTEAQNNQLSSEQENQRRQALQSRIGSLRQQRDREKLDKIVEQIIFTIPLDSKLREQAQQAMLYIEFSHKIETEIKELRSAEDATKYKSVIARIKNILEKYAQFRDEQDYKNAAKIITNGEQILEHLTTLSALNLSDLKQSRNKLPEILKTLQSSELSPYLPIYVKKYTQVLTFLEQLNIIEANLKQGKFDVIKQIQEDYIYNPVDISQVLQNLFDFYCDLAKWAKDVEQTPSENLTAIERQKFIQSYDTLLSKEQNLGFNKRIPSSIKDLRKKLSDDA